MGWENVFQVEIDSFCQKVLTKNFPNVTRYGDIKQFDGTKYRGTIDILTGGFPCQPFSTAGKRKGTEDDRHLWPQMLRVIGEVQPRWIVGENVSGLLNWSGGLVLKQIKIDMENQGYQFFPPCILPACGINAPHKRDRIWIIAHAKSNLRNDENRCESRSYSIQEERSNEPSPFTHTNAQGLQERILGRITSFYRTTKPLQGSESTQTYPKGDFREFPTQSPVCGGNDGVSNRVDRIAALGNAIVPQVAFEIFKAISKTIPERR